MLYKILLFPARILIRFYFRKIVISKKEVLRLKGPLLIASSHPNSFLDAIILAVLFRHPVYSLTRGDVFAGNFITKILTSLKMLPVYRITEGTENLGHNYTTFEACRNIFKNNGIVLIFSEAKSINEWHLRPLRKGTARLAISAWENNVPLQVLPLGINYSSFRTIGKKIVLNFGDIISKKDIDLQASSGKVINEFNILLQQQLRSLVFEIPNNDDSLRREYFYDSNSLFKKVILFFPAAIGLIFNAPLYYCIHFIIKNKATDHYDSIMLGVLYFTYPLYVLAVTFLIFFFIKLYFAFLLLFIIPFTAAAFIKLKKINR